LLLLLPFLLPFLAVRVSTLRRVSVLRGSPPPRIGEALLGSLRLAGVVMAPQLLYLNLYGLLFFGPGPLAAWAEEHPAVGMVSAAALFFVVFAASPAMVRYLFPREDMARVPGLKALDLSLKALGEAAGLRVRRIFVWRTGAQRVANAAVAGVLGRYQRFFITDHLLRRLEPEEIHAVMAHELGHATLRHPLYNFFLAVSAGVFLAWSLLALLPWVEGLDLGRGWGPPLLLGLDALYIFTVFGFFLRRFEHQADMVAVALTGGPEPFSRALVALGHLALVPDRRRSLTHPSIRQRLAWLDVRLARAPAQDWIRRFRRSNLLLLSVLLVLYGATLALVELA
ncbi:MAG: M48 family metalloprotease, partial [Deltaproteobacteria bacterium]|nr:M48 family metalloprotease [Deltaproteobacteria bacterium]